MGNCYRCGGKTKHYSGMLGYEAMKCNKCGHEYSETSKEEYEENKKLFKKNLNKLLTK